ncbi:ECF RNA polymerase sigma factor SigK [uncultured Arthrobacter sp.]|uniref:ECF RNA polymerase sigma factor SigK n=1 Tax=uncultured Arthrobacter sp. TaxID=114050 RepID=UPI0025CB9D5A|nr:ECF RNA polymerase sigma factor SigK [uncultured Arthrobacter sp.]
MPVLGTPGHRPAPGPPSDLSDLLCSAAEQDEEAFEELYRRCSPRVYALVRRVIVDAELSAETTQEVFLAIWQGGPARFDPRKGTAMAWILTIAHRKAVDKVRSEQSRRDRDVRWGLQNQDVDHGRVFDTVATRLEGETVTACLNGLSAVQREAIHLAFYAGLTYSEVAGRLNIPVPTAKTRIRDGLRRLGACLNPE